MKDVVVISNYWHFDWEKGSSRYLTLANMIAEAGMELEIVTSDFYHAAKSHRVHDESRFEGLPYRATFIHEKGYKKNISLARLASHRQFADNVSDYLRARKKPDVIYCFVPPLDLAEAVGRYAEENGIRLIFDILDLWPEAYKMVFRVPVIKDLVFGPMKRKADKAYAMADEIVAVSDTYVRRAMEVNMKCGAGHPVFIGAELSKFDQAAAQNSTHKPAGEIWVTYIGTLGHSYDLIGVIDALKILKDRGVEDIKFLVLGDGPLREKFESHARESGVFCEFRGKVSFGEMVGLLKASDIAVNPITKGAAQSIINKHADYLAAGLPILNTQESPEFRSLVEDYGAGLNCENDNPRDLADKLMILYGDSELRARMGENSRRLAEDKFDRNKTYGEIIDLIIKD